MRRLPGDHVSDPPGASVDTLITIAIAGVWSPLLVLAAIAAIRATADSWHRRHQRGRHHFQPGDRAQRAVEEIASRLAKEAARPRRKIKVIPRKGKDPGPVTAEPSSHKGPVWRRS
jgi:hypothetical protein